jgi:hypothetical protein
MSALYIEVKTLPDSIKDALASVGYHRGDIDVEVSTQGRIGMAFGDGHRGVTVVVNLATGERKVQYGSWGGANPFVQNKFDDNPDARPELSPGTVCIHGSTGHRNIVHLIVHPDNAAPLLPEKVELSDRQKKILAQFRSLTSRGRKDQWEREPGDRPTEAELDELVAGGFLKRNKAGAIKITTEGRNASAGANYW